MHRIKISSQRREEIIDITSLVRKYLAENQFVSGILAIYSPHTTAALTVNENADPDVKGDILSFLNKTIPRNGGFAHAEGNSDAHIKGTLAGFSHPFIVENGKLQLGAWQGIYFLEFDGPRDREIWLKFIPG
ncbi:MAG: secondary thiamine-phosphate synthase enzyme YjbQ [Candidatus Omnitrophota bacterium]